VKRPRRWRNPHGRGAKYGRAPVVERVQRALPFDASAVVARWGSYSADVLARGEQLRADWLAGGREIIGPVAHCARHDRVWFIACPDCSRPWSSAPSATSSWWRP
jgi:hypothetical protein